MTRWKLIHGANRRWSMPANGMSSKYDAHSANVRMNWNASATTSIPSMVLSLTAMATFTNASPHTMIVNAPSSLDQVPLVDRREVDEVRSTAAPPAGSSPPCPTAAPMMRPTSGNGAAARKHSAASAWMPARRRANAACGTARQRGAPVHGRDGPHQGGVGAEEEHLVVDDSGARLHRDERDHDHLREHEEAVPRRRPWRKRLVNMVVDSHTHHTAQNTATTHAMRDASWRWETAELKTRMAATKTRS